MLHSPPFIPAAKRDMNTKNRLSSPRTPPASLPRIKGSQQCSNTGCIPPDVVVADVVVAAAAPAVVTAAAMLVATVADLQQKYGTGVKGVVDAPLSSQISPADPAADASFLAALASDARGAAVPPVDGAAFASASDDTAPADDSRAPIAPLVDAAEGTVPPVAGSVADLFSDAAATADDASTPPTDAAEGTLPPVAGAAVNTAVPSAKVGALPAPPTDAVGKTVPPVAGAAAGTAADAAPADDAGASATPFEYTARKTRVPVTAAAASAGRMLRWLLPLPLQRGEYRRLHLVRVKPFLKGRSRDNGGWR